MIHKSINLLYHFHIYNKNIKIVQYLKMLWKKFNQVIIKK